MVSIHAPVRGATLCAYAVVTTPVFQSTPLCEGRPMRVFFVLRDQRFNPRPCARGDR